MSAFCRYRCKSPKLPADNFLATRRALPKSPVNSSSGDEAPHIFTRKSRLRPGEFLITSAKRLLQQYRPTRDIGRIEILQRSNLLPGRYVLSFARKPAGLVPCGRSSTQCPPRYEGERHDAGLLHIAVASCPRLRERRGVGTGFADPTAPSEWRLFRRRHRRRYGACGLRSALEPAPSAGGRWKTRWCGDHDRPRPCRQVRP